MPVSTRVLSPNTYSWRRTGMVAYHKQPAVQGTEQADKSAGAAKAMGAKARCDLATRVLAGNESVSEAARQRQVSRKFVAKQKAKAQDALDEAFVPSAK